MQAEIKFPEAISQKLTVETLIIIGCQLTNSERSIWSHLNINEPSFYAKKEQK